MVQVRELVENHICWLLRLGQCNFWFDNWLGFVPLCQWLESVSDHLAQNFLLNGHWDRQLIVQWVPDFIASEILGKSAPALEGNDYAIWCLTEFGRFSVSSSYQVIRAQECSSFMFSEVWNSVIPIKISFFMVRFLQDWLPLANSLCRLSIHGPPKCFYCAQP